MDEGRRLAQHGKEEQEEAKEDKGERGKVVGKGEGAGKEEEEAEGVKEEEVEGMGLKEGMERPLSILQPFLLCIHGTLLRKGFRIDQK